MAETYNPTYEELVVELQQIAPQAVEIAALRVKNRKLEEALGSEDPLTEKPGSA